MEQLIAALNQALDMLDESTSIIQELVAQNQQLQSQKNGTKDSLDKRAEVFASKTGLSYKEAETMIKEAEDRQLPVESVLDMMNSVVKRSNRSFASFGKVASEDPLSSSASSAEARFKELQAELLSDLGM